MDIKDYIFKNQEYFEDFITRSTYHSNGIEGNTLSYAETYAILFNDNEFQVSAKPREIYEAINHKYAVNYILNHLDEELSERIIKDTAILINRNISEISGYRTVSVRIRGAEHIPPEPVQIPQQMMYFVYNYNHTEFDSVYQKIAQTHLRFEQIHPFEDGNGRTGRLLLNYELLKNNLAPVVIPKDRRSDYFEMLGNNDSVALEKFLEELSMQEQERIRTMPVKESVVETLKENKRKAEAKDAENRKQPHVKTEQGHENGAR
ncbi:MAG: Fic family protein [Lachnospiraceae bacterium]|mgnify:FL=1